MQLEAEYIVVSSDNSKKNQECAERVKNLISGGAIIVNATAALDSVHYVIRKTTFLDDMNAEINDARLMSEKIKAAREAEDEKELQDQLDEITEEQTDHDSTGA